MQQFEAFEATHMDPLLRRMFDKITTYNQLLAEQPVDLDTITEIVNDVNEEWEELLGEDAVMTGLASYMIEDAEELRPDTIRKDYYENQTVSFRGVLAHAREFGEPSGDEPTWYDLRIGLIREGLDSRANHLIMNGSARIDDIISFEFEEFMSPERARGWLEYHFPDMISDIDHEVFKEATDECERIMRLAEYEWKLTDTPHGEDEAFLHKTKAALQVYLASLFSFDRQLGYELFADGSAWLHHRSGELQWVQFTAGALATVKSVEWEAAPEDDDDVVRPHLRMLLHHDDMDDAPIELTVPLTSIDHLGSIRATFYKSLEDKPLD